MLSGIDFLFDWDWDLISAVLDVRILIFLFIKLYVSSTLTTIFVALPDL